MAWHKYFYRPAAAGYRALRLLLLERPQIVNTFAADIWRKWSGIILGYPEQYGTGDLKSSQTLVRLAQHEAPDAITTTLLLLIDKENQDHGVIFILPKIEQIWDDQLAVMLREKLNADAKLKPQSFEQLFSALMERDAKNGPQFAKSLLVSGVNGPDSELKRVKVAKALLGFAAPQSWDTVWPAIQKDNAFGRRFAEAAHDEPLSQVPKLATTLPPHDVGQLFIWLEHEFPHMEDPKQRGGHAITSRETIGYYRDALLYCLERAGHQSSSRCIAERCPIITSAGLVGLRGGSRGSAETPAQLEWCRSGLLICDGSESSSKIR